MIIDAHAHMDEIPALGWIDPPERVIKFTTVRTSSGSVISMISFFMLTESSSMRSTEGSESERFFTTRLSDTPWK